MALAALLLGVVGVVLFLIAAQEVPEHRSDRLLTVVLAEPQRLELRHRYV